MQSSHSVVVSYGLHVLRAHRNCCAKYMRRRRSKVGVAGAGVCMTGPVGQSALFCYSSQSLKRRAACDALLIDPAEPSVLERAADIVVVGAGMRSAATYHVLAASCSFVAAIGGLYYISPRCAQGCVLRPFFLRLTFHRGPMLGLRWPRAVLPRRKRILSSVVCICFERSYEIK